MKGSGNRRPAAKKTTPTRRGRSAIDRPDPRDVEPPDARRAIEDEACGRPVEPLPDPDFAGGAEREPDDWIPSGKSDEPEAEEPDEPPLDAVELPPAPSHARRARSALREVRILSTVEIFAPMSPTAWLVRELQLAPGRPPLLFGSAGAGKTIIAQSLALAVASGAPAWGEFPTRMGRVLHVDYDQGEGATRKRYRRLAAGHGIDLAALGDRLRYMPRPPVYLHAPGAEAFLLEHCEGTSLCVIDALRGALHGLDENDSRIGAHLGVCSRVSETTGTVFLVLHHLGKPKEGASDSAVSPRGSSALLAGSGAAILVTGGKGAPKRVRIVRDSESFEGDPSADFALRFEDLPASGDLPPLRVLYDGAAPAPPAEDKRAELEAAIVEHVRANPGCGVTAVRKAIGGNAERVTQAIDALAGRGALRREEGARGAARLFVAGGEDGRAEDGPDA